MKSTSVPSKSIHDLIKFCRTASVVTDIKSLRYDTLHLMRRIFQSDSTIIWHIDEKGRIADPLKLNIRQRFFPMYRDYFFKLNPFDPINMKSFRGTSASMEQIVSFDEFKKTEYYNDFIKPQKIKRQMVVYVRTDHQLKALICTHRFNHRQFDQEDLNAADIVSTQMSSALERIGMIEAIRRRGSLFQMILNSTDVGIVALDLGKKPLFFNTKAVHIFEKLKKEPISKHERNDFMSLVPPPVLNDCDALISCHEKELKIGIDSFPMQERSITISHLEKCRFRCRIVHNDMTEFNQPLILVYMEVLSLQPCLNPLAVKNDFNLTKRETEIVTYVIKGYKNARIAETLFISEGTVKNHLRNIFRKAKVNNRSSLIHRVLSL